MIPPTRLANLRLPPRLLRGLPFGLTAALLLAPPAGAGPIPEPTVTVAVKTSRGEIDMPC